SPEGSALDGGGRTLLEYGRYSRALGDGDGCLGGGVLACVIHGRVYWRVADCSASYPDSCADHCHGSPRGLGRRHACLELLPVHSVSDAHHGSQCAGCHEYLAIRRGLVWAAVPGRLCSAAYLSANDR